VSSNSLAILILAVILLGVALGMRIGFWFAGLP